MFIVTCITTIFDNYLSIDLRSVLLTYVSSVSTKYKVIFLFKNFSAEFTIFRTGPKYLHLQH